MILNREVCNQTISSCCEHNLLRRAVKEECRRARSRPWPERKNAGFWWNYSLLGLSMCLRLCVCWNWLKFASWACRPCGRKARTASCRDTELTRGPYGGKGGLCNDGSSLRGWLVCQQDFTPQLFDIYNALSTAKSCREIFFCNFYFVLFLTQSNYCVILFTSRPSPFLVKAVSCPFPSASFLAPNGQEISWFNCFLLYCT